MPVTTDAELRALLLDCLTLWNVAGRVEAHERGLAVNGSFVVQRAPSDLRPVRWLLHRPDRGPRPAPSIGALLTALRNALIDAPGRSPSSHVMARLDPAIGGGQS